MNNKPEQFILTSDYGTLKNDATGTITLSIPSGITIPSGDFREYSNTLTIGTINASTRIQITSSADPSNWTYGNMREVILRIRDSSSFEYDQSYVVNVERTSSTDIRMYIRIPNLSPFPFTIISGVQTVTADIATFLSPFN